MSTTFLTGLIWLSWLNQTLLMNQAPVELRRHTALVLVSMGGVAVVAVSLSEATHWMPSLFVAGYVVARVALWPLWDRTLSRLSTSGRRRQWVPPVIFGPGLAAFWLGTILLPEPFIYWAWVLLFAVETGIIVRGLPTVHHEGMHLVERAGLFVLILLGDSIVELIVAVDSDGPPLGWVIARAAFIMTCLFWASYFSLGRRVPNLQERVATGATGQLVRDIVVFGHFLLVLGLLMLAAGFRTAIEYADAEQAPSAVVVGVAGGSILYFLAQTLMAIRCGFPPAWVAAWMLPSVAIAGLVIAFGTAWPGLAVVLVSLAATIVHLVMGEVLAATSKL